MQSRKYGIILRGVREVGCNRCRARCRLREPAQAVAQAYAERGDRTSLVVCATHDEVDRVTEAIRGQRKKSGELGQGFSLVRRVSLGWTVAQKMDYQNFRPGQILEFHGAVKGIAKHEATEVVRADNDGVVVRTATGIERTLTGKQAKSFDVMEAKPIDISPGDRLLLTANRREQGLRTTNGELVTVTAVDSAGRVHLEDGRTLPVDYRGFAHGYAVTAHRSQGKTVDSVNHLRRRHAQGTVLRGGLSWTRERHGHHERQRAPDSNGRTDGSP